MDLDGTLLMMRERSRACGRARRRDARPQPSQRASSAQQVRARDLTFRPQRQPGYALKKLTDARGETYWILRTAQRRSTSLTAEQVFLWDQMDGTATVQDIAVAYMLEYGKLAITGLLMLLDQLQQKFIAPLVNIYGAADRSLAERRAACCGGAGGRSEHGTVHRRDRPLHHALVRAGRAVLFTSVSRSGSCWP